MQTLAMTEDVPGEATPRQRAEGTSALAMLERQVAELSYAFQPIVNIHTGAVFGWEALLRGWQKFGYETPRHFIDAVAEIGLLAELEEQLEHKVLWSFRRIYNPGMAKLFYNLDPRLLLLEDGHDGGARGAVRRFGHGLRQRLSHHNVHPGLLCIEVTERSRLIETHSDPRGALTELRRDLVDVVLDDFGTGFSGLQILYELEPEFIKIDRFFIQNIAADNRKRLFASSIVSIAHTLGIRVIAEGVESAREYLVCRDIGCDLAQGYLIQRPTTDVSALDATCRTAEVLARRDMRTSNQSDQAFIRPEILEMPVIYLNTRMLDVLEFFRKFPQYAFFPVIDEINEPVGIVRERDLKEIVYSLYGRDLMQNPRYGRTLQDFLVRVPVADVETKAERILDLFTMSEYPEGVIMVRNMKYVGVLTATSLLKIVRDKDLVQARDQNPLSRLPGGGMVQRYLQEAAQDTLNEYAIAYLDFDNFKPFNDHYGFRYGDRAITLFAELLGKELAGEVCFIGHIGGDDFFLGFRNPTRDHVLPMIERIRDRFRSDVESLYDAEARRVGHIVAKDRYGQTREFPLLSVSTAIMVWPPTDADVRSLEALSRLSAQWKKQAKADPSKIACMTIGPDHEEPGPG